MALQNNIKNNGLFYLIFILVVIVAVKEYGSNEKTDKASEISKENSDTLWQAPSLYLDNASDKDERRMINYGHDLIMNTAQYFGPNGSVNQISNGMNCQNCHLDAGTRPWGNNYSAVASTYPKLRARSGRIEDIPKRVNDCFERSLNGKAIDTVGKEMKAIVAYMQWLGQHVKKGEKPAGVGLAELKYLTRAASPNNGQVVYIQKCQTCHGSKGEGVASINNAGYTYPPLWGIHSYNDGAGLYRLSRFAGYVKNNMPNLEATYLHPVLTDEESWDVAAYVNTQPRPKANSKSDWPNIADKPVDHPFGPYADEFSEQQHKYGPFTPIANRKKELKKELKNGGKNKSK